MKKLLSMLLALVAILAMVSTSAMAADIALVTDVGTIDDESFNQACWQGVEAYATANGLSYQYYQPAADSDDERFGSIDQAVTDGAPRMLSNDLGGDLCVPQPLRVLHPGLVGQALAGGVDPGGRR